MLEMAAKNGQCEQATQLNHQGHRRIGAELISPAEQPQPQAVEADLTAEIGDPLAQPEPLELGA